MMKSIAFFIGLVCQLFAVYTAVSMAREKPRQHSDQKRERCNDDSDNLSALVSLRRAIHSGIYIICMLSISWVCIMVALFR